MHAYEVEPQTTQVKDDNEIEIFWTHAPNCSRIPLGFPDDSGQVI